MQVILILNAAVLSRKILVKAKYQIRTRYRQILNIKGLKKKEKKNPKTTDWDIPNGYQYVTCYL